ncbi:MAG: DUF1993 domain-containing protein [Bdellovibrionaceae bacterium]|nr:DUF1993 domain-containing protein [Pseudobdellovibrionaceae bacterium]
MKHSVNDLIVNQYISGLKALKGILKKAQAFAAERKFDENSFLQLRLAPDMFPLVKQVQIVSDTAKGTVAKLAAKAAPVFEDNEKTLSELFTRIDKTIDFLKEFKNEEFSQYTNQKITFHWNPGVYMMGDDYLVTHSIPNFYFHMTIVYSLLRLHGVCLGKGDFLGEQNFKNQ